MTLALDEVDDLVDRGARDLRAAGDDFALGRAWHCRDRGSGVYRFRYVTRGAVDQLRTHYARSGFAQGSALFLIAAAAYRGPTPASEGIDTLQRVARHAGTPFWQSFILPMLAGARGDGRALDGRARTWTRRDWRRREFAEAGSLATSWAALAAEVELLAGDLERAEAILVAACEWLRRPESTSGSRRTRQSSPRRSIGRDALRTR